MGFTECNSDWLFQATSISYDIPSIRVFLQLLPSYVGFAIGCSALDWFPSGFRGFHWVANSVYRVLPGFIEVLLG